MATEDMEMREARGAGESCPPFPKMVPDDPISEGKSRASLEAETPKPDSSYDHLEEMETCEDRGCPGPLKSLSPKAGPTTKGQAGDGPEVTEIPAAPETPGSLETTRNAEMELEKVRMEFELTRLKYVHEENERQRQHEEVMEQLQQQATPRLLSGGLQDLLLPQNQFAMFLYCFIFIHIIYVTKEMIFFLFSKHYLFCIAAILLCLIKTLWSYPKCLVLSITGNLCTTTEFLGPDPVSPSHVPLGQHHPTPFRCIPVSELLSGKKRLCSQPFTSFCEETYSDLTLGLTPQWG
ncbi:PREDICTED: transmembrane protein 247 [Condylura cristata]|uniref:transmembrane protein 247 n=1 Tax=Condylura cristata TaxID=143302 RepID=UPI0006439669|nr:PREDICTED: transmembrane protein 247 [Condylura cristata]